MFELLKQCYYCAKTGNFVSHGSISPPPHIQNIKQNIACNGPGVQELRGRILKRVQIEQPDAVLDQRQLAANICHQMAEHANTQRNYAAAISHYKVPIT